MRTWASACLIKLLNEYPCQININKTSGNIKKKKLYIYIYKLKIEPLLRYVNVSTMFVRARLP